jgi:hypothetical protein
LMKRDGPSKQVGQPRDNDSKNMAPLCQRMGVTGTDEEEDQIPLDAAAFVRDVRKSLDTTFGGRGTGGDVPCWRGSVATRRHHCSVVRHAGQPEHSERAGPSEAAPHGRHEIGPTALHGVKQECRNRAWSRDARH